jgi:hypothetical protein
MTEGSSPGRGWEFFSSPPCLDCLWGPPSLLHNGYQGSFLGVKRPVREADRSPPSSAEVKECVELYLHSPICVHGAQLEHSDNFTFTVLSQRGGGSWYHGISLNLIWPSHHQRTFISLAYIIITWPRNIKKYVRIAGNAAKIWTGYLTNKRYTNEACINVFYT